MLQATLIPFLRVLYFSYREIKSPNLVFAPVFALFVLHFRILLGFIVLVECGCTAVQKTPSCVCLPPGGLNSVTSASSGAHWCGEQLTCADGPQIHSTQLPVVCGNLAPTWYVTPEKLILWVDITKVKLFLPTHDYADLWWLCCRTRRLFCKVVFLGWFVVVGWSHRFVCRGRRWFLLGCCCCCLLLQLLRLQVDFRPIRWKRNILITIRVKIRF